MTDTPAALTHADENHLIAERRAKLAALREQGIAFPNDFRRDDYAGDLQAQFADAEPGRPRRSRRSAAASQSPAACCSSA